MIDIVLRLVYAHKEAENVLGTELKAMILSLKMGIAFC